MVDCMECTNFIECHYSGQLTGRLTSCPDFRQKPKTNADRIRAMTDEELVKYFWEIDVWDSFDDRKFCDSKCNAEQNCDLCRLKWLQQPAEGDA